MKASLKGFYFDTNIVLIDDNDSFLNTLNYRLSEKFSVTIYNEPQVALDYFISASNIDECFNTTNFIIEPDNEEEDSSLFGVDFSKIMNLNNTFDKNKLTSVLIIDYSMPIMNGVDFCERIKHLPVTKILLTGHADFKIAVDAFNRGIIDRFLVKDTPGMLDEIVLSIKELQRQYFSTHSSILQNFLPASCLEVIRSSEFVCHFDQLIEEYSIIEYCLIDNEGAYLLTANDGKKYYFKAILDTKIQEILELAIDLGASSDIVNKLSQKTHIPIFYDEFDYKLPVNDWKQLMHKIEKRKGYYYLFEKKEII